MATVLDLEQLGKTCLATATTIKKYLASNGLPQPSFDQNASSVFPTATPEIQMARMQLRSATKTLYDLVTGPKEIVEFDVWSKLLDLASFRYIFTYDIARAVPFDADISYSDLSIQTKTDLGQLKKMVRQVIPLHVFHEPRPGHVAHTAASRILTQDEGRGYNAYIVEDCLQIAAKHVEAVDKWGHGAQEPTQSAMNLAFNTDLPFFTFFNSEPARRDRFSKLMQAVMKEDIFDSRHILTLFDWSSLGESTVVDVGGNMGHTSVAIAAENPKIRCVVQDLPPTIAHAQDLDTTVVPSDLKDRVTFMAHDFYQPQPVKGADAYFLRFIMHDYSDKYCVKILKAIVPAMAPSSKILIMDQVLPPVGVAPAPVERTLRTMDTGMMLVFNGKEREIEEWETLVSEADPRLMIKNVKTPPQGGLSIIEIVLRQ